MFSFLQSRPQFRLGVELGNQNWVGVMIDPQGVPQQRHRQPAPSVTGRPDALRALLQHFPLKQCNLVLSVPQEYNFKTWELESRDAINIRNQSERWLPYNSSEACCAWHALGPKNTLIAHYPTELLQPLHDAVVPSLQKLGPQRAVVVQ